MIRSAAKHVGVNPETIEKNETSHLSLAIIEIRYAGTQVSNKIAKNTSVQTFHASLLSQEISPVYQMFRVLNTSLAQRKQVAPDQRLFGAN